MSGFNSEITGGFYDYLVKIGKLTEEEALQGKIDQSEVNIFMYAEEFKKYLAEENYANYSDIYTKSISDLEEMDYVNGKLIDSEEDVPIVSEDELELYDEYLKQPNAAIPDETETAPEAQTTPETQTAAPTIPSQNPENETPAQPAIEQPQDPQQPGNTTTQPATEPENKVYTSTKELLKDMISDKDVIDCLDTDGDGQLSSKEISKFEDYVKGDNDEISLEDLEEVYESIKNGTFDKEKYADFVNGESDIEETEVEEREETEIPSSPQSNSPSGANGGGGGGGGGSPSSGSSSSSKSSTPKEKTLDTMTREELEKEKANAQKTLSDEQENLTSILDGSDEGLASMQENVDKAYETFHDELEKVAPELAQQLDDIVGRIKEQESAIDKQELAVCNQTQAVSEAETGLSNARSTRDAAKDAYDSLKDVNTSELSDEKKADIEAKKEQAKEKYEAAKTEVEKAQQNLTKQKETLTELQQQLDTLKGEEGLGKLKNEKAELDERIRSEHQEVSEYQDEYNSAKEKYDKEKSTKLETAKSSVGKAQEYVGKVDTAINNLENKEMKKDLSFSKTGDLFNPDSKLAKQYVNDGKHLPYMMFGPEPPDPDKDYPVIVYLHGDYQMGGGEGIMNETMPGVFMNGELENFDGYVICPQLTGQYSYGNWQNGNAESALRDLITDFSSSHNVNSDMIALTGGSRGAMGVEYMAQHMSDVFCSAAAISSFPTGINLNDIDIPLRGYVGTSDSAGAISYMNSVYTELIKMNANHNNSPNVAFGLDQDHNGRSDLIEWLFSHLK